MAGFRAKSSWIKDLADMNEFNNPAAQPEPMMTVAQAVAHLTLPAPLSTGTLSQLGKDCTLTAKAMKRPTGVVVVYGKRWPTEKSYTFDVLREVFMRNPATRAYVPAVTP